MSVKWAQDSWAVRAGYSTYHGDVNSPSIEAAVKSFTGLPAVLCSNCSSVVPAVAGMKNIDANISTVGFTYDDGVWIAQAEWAKRESPTVIITSVSGWSALGGYRYGNFTPYVGVGRFNTEAAEPGLMAGPAATAGVKAQLNYLNKSYMGIGNNARDVMMAGVRWDFAKNLALKMQLESLKMDDPAVGASNYIQYPTSMLGKPNGFDGRVSMFTLNLDFVF